MGRRNKDDDYGADELESKVRSKKGGKRVNIISPRRQQNQDRLNALQQHDQNNTLDSQGKIAPEFRGLYSFVDNPAETSSNYNARASRNKKEKGSLAIPEPSESEPESASVQEETPSEEIPDSEEERTRRKQKEKIRNKRHHPPAQKKSKKKSSTEVKKIECSALFPCISKRCLILSLGVIILISLVALITWLVMMFASRNVDMRLQHLDLDLDNVILLQDKPSSYEDAAVYGSFKFVLDQAFVDGGNVSLKSYRTWYDDYNIEGMQFTFTNGEEDSTSEVYGLTMDRRGIPVADVVIDLEGEQIETIERLMVNTQVTPDLERHSGWYLVNFGLNGLQRLRAGFEDSKYAAEKALRDPMTDTIEEDYRIVGVYGYIRISTGTLRSCNFIVAKGTSQKLL